MNFLNAINVDMTETGHRTAVTNLCTRSATLSFSSQQNGNYIVDLNHVWQRMQLLRKNLMYTWLHTQH